MKKSNNYRDILAQAMGGVTFNKTMVVHHLNHDRSDNRVMNLLLIPRSLHSRYHAAYNELKVFRKIDLYKVDDQNIVCHRVIQEFFDYKADMEIFMYAQNHCIFGIQMGADIDQQIEIYCSSVKNLVKKYQK